jgi:hypothetical protein
LLLYPVWHRAEVGPEQDSIDAAHVDCCAEPNGTEPKGVNEYVRSLDLYFKVVEKPILALHGSGALSRK